jgi:hypothetical protein
MMKTASKIVLAVAIAATAASFSTPSFAAKKKAAAAAACVAPKYSVAKCSNNVCTMTWCGLDGKQYPSLLWCVQPFCPK